MYYHASPLKDLHILTPHTSNYGSPLLYLSAKRENTLPYLSNAIELYGKRSGKFPEGPYHKWASYGFTGEGILHLEEYYPNAAEETYKGISGYIYTIAPSPDIKSSRTYHMLILLNTVCLQFPANTSPMHTRQY